MTVPADASKAISERAPSPFRSSLLAFARGRLAGVLAAMHARSAAWEEKAQRRRKLAEVTGLSEDLLRDMGATRGDLELELRRPMAARHVLHRRSGNAELTGDSRLSKGIPS